MGQIVNPISLRLNKNRFWLSSWSSNSLVLVKDYYFIDYSLQKYVFWILNKEFITKFGIMPVDFLITSSFNKINVNINFFFTLELGDELKRIKKEFLQKFFLILLDILRFEKTNYLVDNKQNKRFNFNNNLLSEILKSDNDNKQKKFNKDEQNFLIENLKRTISNDKFLKIILNKYSMKKLVYKFSYNITNFLINSFKARFSALLSKYFFQSFGLNISFKLSKINRNSLTAKFLSSYISIKLRQKFNLKVILNTILNRIKTIKLIKGFKIQCSGRFDKKQRTTYMWEDYGTISSTKITRCVDYSENVVVLKYGACGIKIWLYRQDLNNNML